MRLEAGEIAHRRIEPDVEILAGRVGNRDAEVRRIARDVPVGEALAAGTVAEPLERLVGDFGLQAPGRLRPFLQEFDARGIRKPEEEMVRRLAHGSRARDGRVGIFQIGRSVEDAARFAGIAILVLRAAFRAFTPDIAIRQEHLLHRIVELLDGLRGDERRHAVAQPAVDVLRRWTFSGESVECQ